MAFDYGSQALGIPNPFKTEGKIRLIGGLLITLMAFFPLLSVASTFKENPLQAWGLVFIGLFLMTWGLRGIATGAMQLFRFYVGRSVPSSLSRNYAPSERDNAEQEYRSKVLSYTAEGLESMLMGRKNITFIEPQGWLARFVHSVIPSLILAPYPVRNLVQELAGVLSSTLVALAAFSLAFFVTATGLAGDAGDLINSLMSLLLLVYLVFIWRTASNNLNTGRNRQLHSKTAAGLSFLFAFSLVVPVFIGYLHSHIVQQFSAQELNAFNHAISSVMVFDALLNLLLLMVLAAAVVVPTLVLVRERLALNSKGTSVSEYRDNMQESVHPNEIFINIENIVLANRRFREIPNRVYRDFEPKLQEQSQGKGTFKGQLLIETQPQYRAIPFSNRFCQIRLFSTIGAQVLTVISAALLYALYSVGVDSVTTIQTAITNMPSKTSSEAFLSIMSLIGHEISGWLTLLFAFLAVVFAGRMLINVAHTFWSEIQFTSLLLSIKTEGTYTESKISTGMAYNDSTRSENVVVRSSITPWVLLSTLQSSTYATTGSQNLEMPRFVMGMEENKQELDTIVDEIHSFLRGREFIASINNEKDLANAERIYQVNRISKSDEGDLRSLTSSDEDDVPAKLARQSQDDELTPA